ncbi:hypothetical protein BDQ12DRAFT_198450 [Crucibulum laeve]|uniref:Uncharacterized protein n=1 Tax=Crucibulum laeve TaxID=68775 RepID=A0A5C3MFZ0_9AGAR|nr:hypothetical protein BDQ12DRAFT_198450 [Crucibulum laeve]
MHVPVQLAAYTLLTSTLFIGQHSMKFVSLGIIRQQRYSEDISRCARPATTTLSRHADTTLDAYLSLRSGHSFRGARIMTCPISYASFDGISLLCISNNVRRPIGRCIRFEVGLEKEHVLLALSIITRIYPVHFHQSLWGSFYVGQTRSFCVNNFRTYLTSSSIMCPIFMRQDW